MLSKYVSKILKICMPICLIDGIHTVKNVYLVFFNTFYTLKPKLYPFYARVSVSTDAIPIAISKTESQQKNTNLFL